ncbi:MAG: hypothetical protein QM820_38470 [Minicystis sp.]
MMQSEELLGRGGVTTGERARRAIEETGITAREGIPAEPLFGVLPIRRAVPQNVHSLLDYSNGIVVAWSGLTATRKEARYAGAILGAAVIGVSLFTDYRMSVAKLIPIEVHEVLDHVWGASVIAAPFVFGYNKRAPVTTLVHVLAGAATILGSLFTDYRAVKGVGRGLMRGARAGRVRDPSLRSPFEG